MRISSFIEEVNRYNFASERRQVELGWIEWKCSLLVLESISRNSARLLSNLSKKIQENYDISFKNTLQKENFGGTLTTMYLTGERKLAVTHRDWTMMYRYNIYENDILIKEIEEQSDLITWLNENL